MTDFFATGNLQHLVNLSGYVSSLPEFLGNIGRNIPISLIDAWLV